jgi:hypothetical protein
MPRGADGRATDEMASAVTEGRKRQDRLAAEGLKGLVGRLRVDGFEPITAALLVNRASWITDLLEHSLFAPEHPPVAEGLAVRDALRSAFGKCGVAVVELDEKSLTEIASKALGLSQPDLEIRLKDLGATVGKPWRKEQKLACLAAWSAVKSVQASGTEGTQS